MLFIEVPCKGFFTCTISFSYRNNPMRQQADGSKDSAADPGNCNKWRDWYSIQAVRLQEAVFLVAASYCLPLYERRLCLSWITDLSHLKNLCWQTPTQQLPHHSQLRGIFQIAQTLFFLLFPSYLHVTHSHMFT